MHSDTEAAQILAKEVVVTSAKETGVALVVLNLRHGGGNVCTHEDGVIHNTVITYRQPLDILAHLMDVTNDFVARD